MKAVGQADEVGQTSIVGSFSFRQQLKLIIGEQLVVRQWLESYFALKLLGAVWLLGIHPFLLLLHGRYALTSSTKAEVHFFFRFSAQRQVLCTTVSTMFWSEPSLKFTVSVPAVFQHPVKCRLSGSSFLSLSFNGTFYYIPKQ